MVQDTDHGGGRPDNPYCQHCTDAAGNLKSREEVREGMIAFYMGSMGKTREEAEGEVGTHMAQMPAWAADRPAWAGASPTQTPEPVGTITPLPTMEPPTQSPPPLPVSEPEPKPAGEPETGYVPPAPTAEEEGSEVPPGEKAPSEEPTQ